MNRVLEDVRRSSPARFFDEASEMGDLRETIRLGNVVLGVMSDYNPGPDGLRIPFFGLPVATSAAALIHSHRFGMPIFCAVCFRTGLARWRVELSDRIETRNDSEPRPAAEILADINRHFEISIRRDPANWCWAHERWKFEGREPRSKGQR